MPTNKPGLIASLRDVISGMDYDPDHLTVEQKTDVANRLSKMAGRDEPWGWRYIHNVLGDKIKISGEMETAINRLGAVLDGMNEQAAKGRAVQVWAIGDVQPGALILASSLRCKYPACGKWFVPVSHNQAYHTLECKRAWEKEYKRMKRQQRKGNQ